MEQNVNSFNPKERFSNRVEAYRRFRPHYPPEIISYLKKEINLSVTDVIADIGSGTGFLSERFLENGNTVFGIEPNKEMREAGEHYLNRFENFRSIPGSAEETLLRDHSIDVIAAAQAFHWFERKKFQSECERLLRGKSIICLIWNERDNYSDDFHRHYENLLQNYATDYEQIRHDNITEDELREFFRAQPFHFAKFPNSQRFDFEGVKGRLLSASYIPTEGHPRYGEMIDVLRHLFMAHSTDGMLDMLYETKIYWSKLS